MSRSVNKVILVGHLGKDAETRHTPSGVAVTNFSVATSRRWKDQQTGEWQEATDWHNVQVWRAEKLAEYLRKGVQVYVEGRLQTRSTEKDGERRYFTEVVAEDILLLGGRSGGGESGGSGDGLASRPRTGGNAQGAGRQSAGNSAPGGWSGVSDDDVPF